MRTFRLSKLIVNVDFHDFLDKVELAFIVRSLSMIIFTHKVVVTDHEVLELVSYLLDYLLQADALEGVTPFLVNLLVIASQQLVTGYFL